MRREMTIPDKAVLVTGANRGIGQVLVEEALRRGAKRVYTGTRQPLAHIDGRVRSLTLDVTNLEHIQAAVDSDAGMVDENVERFNPWYQGAVFPAAIQFMVAPPQPRVYFLPEAQEQGSLRPTLG